MREKNSERPDTRDNRSKNSTKTGKKKKNTKNQEFAVITYSFLALFICLMGYFSYFQFFKSEEFINNPYNTRQETFAQKIVRGQILTNDGQVLAETVTDSEGNETRRYPYGSIFSHIVGYSTKGKSGIESTAYDALGYYKGAIVVLEPSTGKILAMVSKPDFDPNTIAADWDNLTADENTDAALLNRATQGLYPPGSTFKILTTLEYIQEHADYENYSYTCTGSYTVGNHTIHCYGNKSHGTQNLRQAFANSCNAFYASLGMELDIDQFGQLCNKMLFNTSLPTDLQASKSSFVLDKSDGSSAIMATSIGQGQTLVTPFHMALLVSAINNDGVLMKPYVLDRVESSDGTLVEQYEPEEYGTLMTTDEAAILKDYMNYVVETGTGKKLSGQSYEAAGKTGSAEYSTGADSSHSWFVGYAHRDDKSDIAIAVIVEKAGVGSEYAVPIAKEVFDAYYNE